MTPKEKRINLTVALRSDLNRMEHMNVSGNAWHRERHNMHKHHIKLENGSGEQRVEQQREPMNEPVTMLEGHRRPAWWRETEMRCEDRLELR